MARPTILQDLKTCVRLELPSAPLVFPIAGDAMFTRLAGATYHDYAHHAATIETVWSQAIETFDLDWAGVFVDDLAEYEPLGIRTIDGPDASYAVAEYCPCDRQTLARLRLPVPTRDGRMPIRLEANARLRQRWGESIVICANVAAPFSGLTLLYGIDETMLALADDSELLRDTMEFLEELATIWRQALIRCGADLIWLGDCSASSRFISEDAYRRYALEPAQRVVKKLKAAGGIVLYHAGEFRMSHLPAMVETGADILSVESGGALTEIKAAIGDRICLSGNLDGVNLIWRKSPAEIEAATSKLVREVGAKGGVIVGTGEGLPRQTPEENLRAMIRGIRQAWPTTG
ncbi:MAG: hypothetical protein IT578_07295 [Verrucomicrobiae bacterium]|nr:hypothetical protein [Verrucomicrobiae bacterium]